MPKPARSNTNTFDDRDARRMEPARVWDAFVRVFHWCLVLSISVAWLTPISWEAVHLGAGYVAGALVTLRAIWGVLGPRHARFSQFVRGPGQTTRYLASILRAQEARYLGHNPAGGAMIVALLSVTAVTAVSGWMMTTDAYYGVSWVEQMHGLAARLLLGLAVVHVAGVILASTRHRENLVLAMITGKKRPADDNDVN
jgi:cytochrome b